MTTHVPTLTPGLTHGQRQAVADALRRVGGVPLGKLAVVFMDADVWAARAFSARYAVRAALREAGDAPRADDVVPPIADEHGVPAGSVAFTFGLAVGLRLGQRFWPRGMRTLRYLPDDFAKLDRNQRDRVTRIVRSLLAGIEPYRTPGVRPGTRRPQTIMAADLEAAKRWKKAAHERVLAESRR